MRQIVNKKYEGLWKPPAGTRYIILMGGRGAGRSTAASQFAISMLAGAKYFRCAIMRYVLGDIRNSIYQEIIDRTEENGEKEKFDINDGLMTLAYGANRINAVGFKKSSGEQKAKLKSLANYNCVLIEEAEEVSEEDFMQLDDSLRTVKGDITIILLLNPPPLSHWIVKRWFNLKPSGYTGFFVPELKPEHNRNTLFIRTWFRDNIKNIDEETQHRYEGYRTTKPAHFFNMIQGLVPEVVRGRIYNNWKEIDDVPKDARLVRRWLDYGYSNDPAAIGEIWKWNDTWILNENLYNTGQSNKDLITVLENMEDQVPVAADSAEPKSNDELTEAGITIIPARKGPDSVNNGIQLVQGQTIYYTKRSVNIKKESENYRWKENKEGDAINVPIDMFNHHMDGVRYAFGTIFDVLDEKTVAKQKSHMNRREEKIAKSGTR